ncbi:mannitol dehydrogenase domain-containing protein, partial [mine drainage metagenome]
SCDESGGRTDPTLRAAVSAFAARRSGELARWIEREVAFPCTMVDSITPATDESVRERVAQAIGLTDAWPVQRESFTQWVIEDLPQVRVADWASVGVQLTNDVGVYERAKLRLLNAAHSTLAYVGLLRGHATVAEAMRDAPLARLVEQLMREDIAPSLAGGAVIDIGAYIEAALGRFRNPSVRHQLEQIAWDGSKKLPVRLLPTLTEALAAGRPLERLAVPAAAWIRCIVARAHGGGTLTDPAAEA